jgi:hypothetical protein
MSEAEKDDVVSSAASAVYLGNTSLLPSIIFTHLLRYTSAGADTVSSILI